MIGKKGGIMDLPLIIGIILAIAISIFMGKVIFSEINDSGAFEDAPVAQGIADQFEDSSYQSFSSMFLIIFIGTLLVLAIGAFLLRTHPAFFPISAFVVIPIVVLISAIISNIFEEFIAANALVAAADNSLIISQIMNNLPFYMFGFGVLLLIITYGLNKAEGL